MKSINDFVKEAYLNESLNENSKFVELNNAIADAVKESLKENEELFKKGLDAFYNKNNKLRAEIDDQLIDVINDYLSEHYKSESDIDAHTILPLILGWTLYYNGKN